MASNLGRAGRDAIQIDDTFTHAEELGPTENSPGGAAVSLFATNQDLDPARLRQAFGIFPSGVVAVAAVVDGVPVGLAASSFRSESLDPPLVSFSISASSKTWPDLRRASRLGVSVLASHHGGLARQLAGRPKTRFDDVAVRTSEAGALVIDEAVAHFDTTIYREVDAGDHVIVLLEIKAVAHPEVGSPLVFHRSTFGRLAGTA
jgi:flavin reductase (DIM6/NTAB) family NADH-FMN oxidoreductase RutF